MRSEDAVYATVWSFGWNITSRTGDVWPERVARAPAVCGAAAMDVVEESLRRLLLDVNAAGRRFVGAGGAPSEELEEEDQSFAVWSAEAERMREEGVCTARELMGRVWP